MATRYLAAIAAWLAIAGVARPQTERAVVVGGSAGFFKSPFASVGYAMATFEHEAVGASFANAGVLSLSAAREVIPTRR